MKIGRLFTTEGKDPYSGIPFEPRTSEIKNPDGSRVFQMDNVMVPAHWSQVATDIMAQKYFRKAGGAAKEPPGERRRNRFPPSLPPAGRLLAQWGETLSAISTPRKTRRHSTTSLLHAGPAGCRAQQSAVVQHRVALRLRNRGRPTGPLLCRSGQRRVARAKMPTSALNPMPVSSCP